MAIYLPSSAEEEQLALDELTPREIVVELDKYVIGQKDAKRAVAIALRNRTRRQKLTAELAEEIIPKNIIMIGQAGEFPVPQSRSLEVHRSRLRRTRCRIHGARPG
jgi:ATP-dependent HslUV protease ATP-binding subunit HslU